MAEVILRHVCKSFGRQSVVKDFCLNIADGEFLVLVGPSGCGKSTTLRLVAGLESLSSGEIHIGERLVNDIQAGRALDMRRIGFDALPPAMPQQPKPSGLFNVDLPIKK